MKLPNQSFAIVEKEKLVGYLLNHSHRVGAGKARFFADFGFSADAWEVLADALRKHAASHEAERVQTTEFGVRYQVDGILDTPDGRSPSIRTVWQVENGEVAPRLITAYPLKTL